MCYQLFIECQQNNLSNVSVPCSVTCVYDITDRVLQAQQESVRTGMQANATRVRTPVHLMLNTALLLLLASSICNTRNISRQNSHTIVEYNSQQQHTLIDKYLRSRNKTDSSQCGPADFHPG